MKWDNWENIKIDKYGNAISTIDNTNDTDNGCSSCESPCPSVPVPSTPKRLNCCCKKSMIEALKLLCNTELSNVIDFEKFAFLTSNFIVGARLVLFKLGSEEKDNLSNLDAKFKRFSPCNCDLIDIEGTVAYDVPLPVSITDLAEQLVTLIQNIIDIIGEQGGILGTIVNVLKELLSIFELGDLTESILQAILDFLIDFFTTIPMVDTASLCAIESIAFEAKREDSTSSSDITREELAEKNYQHAKLILQGQLDRNRRRCGECSCNCECDDCCCTDSILNELFNSNLSRKVTLTAGNLTLREATILGVKGDVLVLANDKKKRFYFVCANTVQFLE